MYSFPLPVSLPPAAMLLLLMMFSAPAESRAQADNRLSGKIVDAETQDALPLSSIRIFAKSDSTFKSGGLTDESGIFSVRYQPGRLYAVIEFMGYEPVSIDLPDRQGSADLGTIRLRSSAKSLQEVTIQNEKSLMEMALDKRIFHVGKDLTSAGGNAADILNNVPSVSVDVDGNVSLRGSSVRILIDGKPSGLVSSKGGSGLQQLQAGMIERIEVITNPSARYEAEGLGGIINIVLKKEQRQGFNGSFDVITGLPANFGGAANLNYRHKDFNFFTNYTLSYRNLPSRGSQYQEVYHRDSVFITRQTSERSYKAMHHNLRMGADYFFDEKTILTAAYTWSNKKGKRYSDLYYHDAKMSESSLYSTTYRTQDETETEPNSEYTLTFKKDFGRKGHTLTALVQHLDNWENSDQYFGQSTVYAAPLTGNDLLQHSVNDEGEKQWLFQADYVRPFSKEAKFETGFRSSFRDMTNNYFVAEQAEDGQWINLPAYTNDFVYDENIHAVYGILGNKTHRISYQVGLRGEWSEVTTTLKQTQEVNYRKYVNLFPSAHLVYDLPAQNAVQISYSRRIRRPKYGDLSPFMTFSDNRNYWSGNPDLNPEFTNAFEAGHIKYFTAGTFSSSVYYRHTDGKIIQIRTVDSSGYAFSRPENLSTEDAYGIELAGSYTPARWLKLDGSGNFYRAVTDGANLDASYRSSTYSWTARINARLSLPKSTELQVRQLFDGPERLPQGSRKSLYVMDLAFSRDILKNKATLTLNVSDVFNSRRYRTISRGENFYTYSRSQGRVRQINLILMYRLKQPKTNRKSSLEDY